MNKKEIKINTEPLQTCEAFDPEGNSLGLVNELQFIDLRAQICQANVSGYYVVHKGQKVYINNEGRLPFFPKDLFHWYEKSLITLVEF